MSKIILVCHSTHLNTTMPAAVIAESGGDAVDFPAKLTKQVLICTLVSAFGGLMFGYDIGISGMLYQSTLHYILNVKC